MSGGPLFIVLGLACAAIVVSCSQTEAQDNLALNAGFELADGGDPAFWEARTPADERREMLWDAEVARSGRRSLAILNTDETLSRWRTGHLRDIVLQPGSQCELRAWVRTEAAKGARLRLYFMSEKDEILAQPGSRELAGDSDWTELVLAHQAPATPSYVMPYVELNGPGKAWFDDVTLTGERAAQGRLGKAEVVKYGPRDFWDVQGFEATSRGGRTVLQLPPDGPTEGEALLYVAEETARYDLVIEYLDEPDGASTLVAVLNGVELGSRRFDQVNEGTDDVLKTWGVEGVDVQRNSRLVLRGKADQGEYCRVVSVGFRPVGAFGGELLPPEEIEPPPSLAVYGTKQEQAAGRNMLGTFVRQYGQVPLAAKRKAELEALQTPDDWFAYQRRVRERLAEFWGPFPERTPLKARVVGRIDRERFGIEKVIYEGRPGYYVTANFYLPKGRELPVPGILFVCGHAGEGKGYHLYHESGLGLALKGYAVLAIDPMGQGERSEYLSSQSADTLKNLVPLTVAQHHQLGRPSFLVGQTLGGYRTWDAVRGVDYLLSRPEVDPERLGAAGNSGGGQMAFLVTAADERIDVCVAAHPGGSMENTYLSGQGLRDREVLSLIAPRPCRVVIGDKSGEGYHVGKVEDMLQFYRGMGHGEERCEVAWVDGVHDMKRPKRVAMYEWFNRWFDKEEEGSDEPPLEPLKPEELWCTETGFTLKSLGGESGRTLNLARMEAILPRRSAPASREEAQAQARALRDAVERRLGLEPGEERAEPVARSVSRLGGEGFVAEKLIVQMEPGIDVPAALLWPEGLADDAPVILHAAERGKPVRGDKPSLPLELCRRGLIVLTVDVRGVGETDPRGGQFKASVAGYNPDDWSRDSLAINAYGYTGRAMAGMRALDMSRAMDYIASREDLKGRRVAAVGEGLGGLWALIAAAFDSRIATVAPVRTLGSYRMLMESPYHEVRGYFWLPSALADFDIPELAALVAPRRVLWIDPVDAMARTREEADLRPYLEWSARLSEALGGGLELRYTEGGSPSQVAELVGAHLRK